MPTTRFRRSLAIGETVLNLLDGSLYEIVSANGSLIIAAVAEGPADVLMTVLAGTETLLEESPVPTETAANVGPILPDNVVLQEPVRVGDKLTLRLRNTGAVARIVRVLVGVP